jgi:HEAT repeat protein
MARSLVHQPLNDNRDCRYCRGRHGRATRYNRIVFVFLALWLATAVPGPAAADGTLPANPASPHPASPSTSSRDAAWWGIASRDLTSRDLASLDLGRRHAALVRMASLGHAEDLRRISTLLDDVGDSSLRLTAARALVRAGDPEALGRMAARASDPLAATRFEALTIISEAPTLSDVGRRVAERALVDTDAAVRLVALNVLSAHPTADSVPIVAGSIADSNREVRIGAIRLLGLCRDSRAMLPLLERLDGADRVERIAIIDALGSIGKGVGLDAGPALARQLLDSNDDVRVAAVDALGRLRWAAAVPALATIAANRSRGTLSRRAALALGDIADDVAISALAKLLREPSPSQEIAEALRRAGRPSVKALAEILVDGYPTSAAAATAILAAIGDRSATPALIAALKARPEIAIGTARALGTIRDPNAVPALMLAVLDPKYAAAPGAREACLGALTAIGDARAAGLAEKTAAGDPDPEIRIGALHLAAAIHAGLSAPTLAARLADDDPLVRRAAVTAVPQLRPLPPTRLLLAAAPRFLTEWPEGHPLLTDILESVVTESDQRLLIESLGRVSEAPSGSSATAFPGQASDRSSQRLPVHLLRALAAIGSGRSLPEGIESRLLAALGPRVSGSAVAAAAAELLAVSAIGERAAQELVDLLPDLDSGTRARLCPALAHAGIGAADHALAEMLDNDPDDGVRAAAAWSARRRRGIPELAVALDKARRSALLPVAGNANAALSDHPPPANEAPTPEGGHMIGGGWVRVRLTASDARPLTGRWIAVRAGGQIVWARTDDRGEAWLSDLPRGPYRLFADY